MNDDRLRDIESKWGPALSGGFQTPPAHIAREQVLELATEVRRLRAENAHAHEEGRRAALEEAARVTDAEVSNMKQDVILVVGDALSKDERTHYILKMERMSREIRALAGGAQR